MADEVIIGEGVISTKIEPYINQSDFEQIARITEKDLNRAMVGAQKSIERLWEKGSEKAKIYAKDLLEVNNRYEQFMKMSSDPTAFKRDVIASRFPAYADMLSPATTDRLFGNLFPGGIEGTQAEMSSGIFEDLVKLTDKMDSAAVSGEKLDFELNALERGGLRAVARAAPGSAEGIYAFANALGFLNPAIVGPIFGIAGLVGAIAGLNVAAYKLATGGLSQANEQIKLITFNLEQATGSETLSPVLEEIRQRANLTTADMGMLAAQTANAGKSMGLTEEQASRYTDELLALAEVMSVIGGVSLPEALQDVQAIMSGSLDSSSKYGINIASLSDSFSRLPKNLTATEAKLAGLSILQSELADSSGVVAEKQAEMGTTIADLQMRFTDLREEMAESAGPATDSLKDSFARLFDEITEGVNGGSLDGLFDKIGKISRSSVELGRQFLDMVGIIERNPVTIQIDFAQVGGYDINADPASTLTAAILGAVDDAREKFSDVNINVDTLYGNIDASLGDSALAVSEIVTGVEAEVDRLNLTADEFRKVMDNLKGAVSPEIFAQLHPELWAIYSALMADDVAARKAAGGLDEYQVATAKTREELLALQGVTLDQANAGYQLIDQVFALAEAQAKLEESTDPKDVLNYSQAFNRLQKSLTEYEGSLDTLTASLKNQYEVGAITSEQYLLMLSIISATAGVAGGAQLGIYNLIGAEQDLSSQSLITANDLNLMIGLLNAVAGAVRQSISNLAIGAQAFYEYSNTAAEAFRAIDRMTKGYSGDGVGGGTAAAIANVTGRLQALANKILGIGNMGDLIGNFGRQFSGAMNDVAGSAGGAADAVGELEEELSDLEIALSAFGEVSALIGGVQGIKDAKREIKDLRQEIEDLKEYQEELPGLIQDYEKELRDAKAAAKAITATEAVRIEQAEENLAAMELAYKQGFATANELKVAEEELAKAREDAVNVEDDPAVIDAQEKLNAAKIDQKNITLAIIMAEEDLMMAELGLIEAQLSLAGAIEDMGEDALEVFRQIAEAVGFSTETIEKMIEAAEKATKIIDPSDVLSEGSSSEEEDDGGSSTSNGGTYTVKAGDTLSKIAASLNYPGGWQALYNKNKDVIGGDPNLIRVGQILKLAKGGDLLPGQIAMVGEEGIPEFITVRQPSTVTPMQDLVDALKSGSGLGGVRDVNIYLQPRWPIDRVEARKIAVRINEEIRQINRMAQM